MEWFHPACLGIPTRTFKLKEVKWWCKKCCKKKGFKDCELLIENNERNKKILYKRKINGKEFEREEPSIVKKVKTGR